MLCTILKSFPFSRDGVTAEQAVAKHEADIPAALVLGLTREGFVRAVPVLTAVEPPLETPAVVLIETAVEPPLEAPQVEPVETKRRGPGKPKPGRRSAAK